MKQIQNALILTVNSIDTSNLQDMNELRVTLLNYSELLHLLQDMNLGLRGNAEKCRLLHEARNQLDIITMTYMDSVPENMALEVKSWKATIEMYHDSVDYELYRLTQNLQAHQKFFSELKEILFNIYESNIIKKEIKESSLVLKCLSVLSKVIENLGWQTINPTSIQIGNLKVVDLDNIEKDINNKNQDAMKLL